MKKDYARSGCYQTNVESCVQHVLVRVSIYFKFSLFSKPVDTLGCGYVKFITRIIIMIMIIVVVKLSATGCTIFF